MPHHKTLADLKETLLVPAEAKQAYEEDSVFTQAELARKTNTTAPNISRIESDPSEVNLQQYLSVFLHVMLR